MTPRAVLDELQRVGGVVAVEPDTGFLILKQRAYVRPETAKKCSRSSERTYLIL